MTVHRRTFGSNQNAFSSGKISQSKFFDFIVRSVSGKTLSRWKIDKWLELIKLINWFPLACCRFNWNSWIRLQTSTWRSLFRSQFVSVRSSNWISPAWEKKEEKRCSNLISKSTAFTSDGIPPARKSNAQKSLLKSRFQGWGSLHFDGFRWTFAAPF